jgi:hypothetical protein
MQCNELASAPNCDVAPTSVVFVSRNFIAAAVIRFLRAIRGEQSGLGRLHAKPEPAGLLIK